MFKVRCERINDVMNFKIRLITLTLQGRNPNSASAVSLRTKRGIYSAVKQIALAISGATNQKPLRIGADSAPGNIIKEVMPFEVRVRRGFIEIDPPDIKILLTKLETVYADC